VPSLLLTVDGRVVGRLEGRSTGRQIDELIRTHVHEEAEADVRVSGRAPTARRVRRGPAARGGRPGTAGT
jgi:hypothetical protein